MMSDIMKELDGPGWYSMTAFEQDVLRLKAVKEIKRLRASLNSIVDLSNPGEIDRLRAALHGLIAIVHLADEEKALDDD